MPFESCVVAFGRQPLAGGVQFCPSGYVRRSEDRLSEPQFQPSPALPGVRVYGQDHLGAGIFPRRNQKGLKLRPGACPNPPSSSCRCKIGEMPRRVPVKCAIPGCHRRLKMTLAEREELRRVGRENNAAAGLVCPAHVRAAFNFEFDDIDIDVPLEELLVEASKETPRWRVMLTPLPGAAGEPESQSTPE